MIRIGTCSWTEKSLIQSGEFYPKSAKTAESRLKYYAGHFDTVEVDFSYYAIPSISNTYLWAQRTPPGFIFHLKVYAALTGHGVDPGTLPQDIRRELPEKDREARHIYIKEPKLTGMIADRFKEALGPIITAGKLGVLVFQFPPWFTYKTENLDAILGYKAMMGSCMMAVEFRHGSWYAPNAREKAFHFLRKNRLVHVVADEPQYGSLATVPFISETTSETAYYRLHGRNKETWLKKGVETSLRYSYLYSDEELKGFMPHIKTAAKNTKATYVMFNNCHGGFAMRNAGRMKEMLEGGPALNSAPSKS